MPPFSQPYSGNSPVVTRRLLQVHSAVEKNGQTPFASVEHPLGVLSRPRFVTADEFAVAKPCEEEVNEEKRTGMESSGGIDAVRRACDRGPKGNKQEPSRGHPSGAGIDQTLVDWHRTINSACVPTSTIRPEIHHHDSVGDLQRVQLVRDEEYRAALYETLAGRSWISASLVASRSHW